MQFPISPALTTYLLTILMFMIDALTLWEKVRTLLLAKQEDIGSKLWFAGLMKNCRGEREDVCNKLHWLFFTVHEIDHPLNISMNRTVKQRTENSGREKRTQTRHISIGLIFYEVKGIVFRGMQ